MEDNREKPLAAELEKRSNFSTLSTWADMAMEGPLKRGVPRLDKKVETWVVPKASLMARGHGYLSDGKLRSRSSGQIFGSSSVTGVSPNYAIPGMR